jgi:hypothetical protein
MEAHPSDCSVERKAAPDGGRQIEFRTADTHDLTGEMGSEL